MRRVRLESRQCDNYDTRRRRGRLGFAEFAKHSVDGVESGVDLLSDLKVNEDSVSDQ